MRRDHRKKIRSLMMMEVLLLFSLLVDTCLAAPTKGVEEASSESSSAVSSLLSSVLSETLYNRMEHLLLDPGRRNGVKSKMVEVAVENYKRQALPVDSHRYPKDFENLAGYWLRSSPGPKVMASSVKSSQVGGDEEDVAGAAAVDEDDVFRTDNYKITDLFTTSTPSSVAN